MPEFFEDTALYYDAGNAEQLAARIREAMNPDDSVTRVLRNRAQARSLNYTWQRTADRTVEQLKVAMQAK